MTTTVGTIAYEDTHLIVGPDDQVTFGRSPENAVRVGHQPLLDELVPRHAGTVFCSQGRLVVANASDRLGFDIHADDRPIAPVQPGAWYAPAEPEFEIHIAGALQYVISVSRNVKRIDSVVVGDDEPIRSGPPTGATVTLTERQRQMLDAYVAPTLRGAGPATHQQVARQLNVSRSLVRLECNKIWSALLLAGIPMRDFPDTRDQIVDAWARHRF